MKRYYIEEAKCGITEGGIACGPCPGSVVATVKFREGDEPEWLSIVETDGITDAFLTKEDLHEKLIQEDFDDDFITYMNDHHVGEFNGITLGEDCRETFGYVFENSDNPAAPLIRYMITLIRCETNEIDELTTMAKGKYADELDIPASDVEEDYLDDMDEE